MANSYCLGSTPRKSEARATPVQPAAFHISPTPPTSDSRKLTFSSPLSEGPTATLTGLVPPEAPLGPCLTNRALTSTVRAVASPSSIAWVSRGGPDPSSVDLEALPPQAARSSAAPASASVPTMAVVLPIAFLLLRPAPSAQPGIRRMIPRPQADAAIAVQRCPARQAGLDQREWDKDRRRQTPELACRGGY